MLTGQDDLQRRLRELSARVPAAVRDQVLPELGADLLQRAKELAPRDTGALIDSGFVETGAEGVEVGFSVPHALAVHETLDAQHDDGQAKFLEVPLFEMESDLERRIAEAVDREVS